MIQTAEGALNETHSILQRMRELAVQAGNDTNTGEDRAQLQKEVTDLIGEIDRIATTTQFNTQNLLDVTGGTTGKFTFQIGANIEIPAGKGISATRRDGTNALFHAENVHRAGLGVLFPACNAAHHSHVFATVSLMVLYPIISGTIVFVFTAQEKINQFLHIIKHLIII